MSSSSISKLVLQLKRQALESKKAGDVPQAKKFLQQARLVESCQTKDNNTSSSSKEWKRVAVLLKQHGDLPGAKEALRQSKLLENRNDTKDDDDQQQDANCLPDPVNRAVDDAQVEFEELVSSSGGKATITFTNQEMLDLETMKDMQESGMDIPSRDEYQRRAAACQRAALAAKQKGDIPAAKQHLIQSKQLTSAILILYPSGNGTGLGPDGGDDEKDLDPEDIKLLEEIRGNHHRHQDDDDGFFQQLFGASSMVIELEDLDDMDAAMLRDAQEAGMEIPQVDSVLRMAQDKKAAAVQLKKAGNLVAAKAALEESKRLQGRASQLADMLHAIESGACDEDGSSNHVENPEALLEAMLTEASVTPSSKEKVQPNNKTKDFVSEKLLSSHDYKVQAVQFKKQGNIPEATAALRLYKQVLATEQHARRLQQKRECIAQLQKESQFAKEQARMFGFYECFVDHVSGQAHVKAWKEYAQQCATAIANLEQAQDLDGPPMDLQRVRTAGNLREIQEDDLTFIGKTMDPKEERIEVCVMECVELGTNKHLRQVLGIAQDFTGDIRLPASGAIHVRATVPLPASVDHPEDDVLLAYEPKNQAEGGSYVFHESQFVTAERGSSRFVKLLLRRVGRRKITFNVEYTSVKKGVFSSSKKEHSLGTAVVELKDLLKTNAIAGDFSLLDATRRQEVGGRLRIAIRTGHPFGLVKETSKDDDDDDQEQMTTANTGLTSNVTVRTKPFSPYRIEGGVE